MAKNLLIVESPAKSKTLKRFLGKEFDVQATVGHIIDLPKSKLGVHTEDGFKIDYELIKGKGGIIKKLKAAAKNSETIYLAPDPDREGEAIAWHVAEQLKNSKNIVRVTFNEITKKAVREALENTREIDINLVNAQQARRVLDRLVGYKVSPFLWKTVTYGLSAGRVQSVALRIICERDAEIEAFVTEEYWKIATLLEDKSKAQLISRLSKIDGKKAEITNEDESSKIVADLKKEKFIVDKVKHSEKKRRPYAPFITSSLQQEAARALYFTPKKTMMVAQKLYEGIELGDEGPVGLITYMRTDSIRLAETAISAARDYIEQNYGAKYLPAKPVRYKAKKGSQDAHEAIRPTYTDHPPEKIKKYLTKDQLRLYTLIWNRFLASQMSPAIFNTTSVVINAGIYQFNSSAQSLKFDGFLKVYKETNENNSNGNGENGLVDSLPDLEEGGELKLLEINPTQHFTKPPARFSQATLVKTLEAEGIGRPSTYASIISTLTDRKYVVIQERRLHPTDLGKTISKILVQSFPTLFNIKFTAEMENELDLIEDGKEDWVDVIRQFYTPFSETLAGLEGKQQAIKDSLTKETGEKCDKCGSPMVIKWGRNGQFMACSAYPDCKNTKPVGEPEEAMKTDEICEKCSSPMVVKVGRFGKFLACSAYPECKTTKAISTGVDCPKDDCKGDVVEKRSKRGKSFYGCSKYPKCDFVSWYKPINKECPECKNNYMFDKISKVKGAYLACPVCKHKIYTEKEDE